MHGLMLWEILTIHIRVLNVGGLYIVVEDTSFSENRWLVVVILVEFREKNFVLVRSKSTLNIDG